MWGFCLRQKDASAGLQLGHGFSVTLSRGDFGDDVAWHVNPISLVRIKYDCAAQLWQMVTSKPFMLHFLSPDGLLPTHLGPSFLAPFFFSFPGQGSSPPVLTGTDCQFKWLYCRAILLEKSCDCLGPYFGDMELKINLTQWLCSRTLECISIWEVKGGHHRGLSSIIILHPLFRYFQLHRASQRGKVWI